MPAEKSANIIKNKTNMLVLRTEIVAKSNSVMHMKFLYVHNSKNRRINIVLALKQKNNNKHTLRVHMWALVQLLLSLYQSIFPGWLYKFN